jgi:hypothetical protein
LTRADTEGEPEECGLPVLFISSHMDLMNDISFWYAIPSFWLGEASSTSFLLRRGQGQDGVARNSLIFLSYRTVGLSFPEANVTSRINEQQKCVHVELPLRQSQNLPGHAGDQAINIPVSNAHGTDTSLENPEDRSAGLHEGLTDPVQTGSKATKEARDGLRKYHRDKRQTGHNRQKKWCHGN